MQQSRIDFGKQIQLGTYRVLSKKFKYSGFRPTVQCGLSFVTVTLCGLPSNYFEPLQKLNTRKQISIECGLPDTNVVRAGWYKKQLLIEANLPQELHKPLLPDLIPDHEEGMYIGADNFNKGVLLNTSKGRHILLAGETQSGKTTLQKYIAYRLLLKNYKVIIVDVAKLDKHWGVFENKTTVLYDANIAYNTISSLLSQARNGQLVEPHYIIIDELKQLVIGNENFRKLIETIAEIGSDLNLRLISATQYPTIEVLGSGTKRNSAIRLCGTVDDAGAAYNVLGIRNSGAEALGGQGEFLLKSGFLTRLKAPLMDDNLILKLKDKQPIIIENKPNLIDNEIHTKLDKILKAVTTTTSKQELTPCEIGWLLSNEHTVNSIKTKYAWGYARAKRAFETIQAIKECMK